LYHHSVNAPPNNVAPTTTTLPQVPAPDSPPKIKPPAPFDGPSVAANCLRGLGAPDTVTVGAEASGLGLECPDEELVTENREETEYVMPCVELRQRRK